MHGSAASTHMSLLSTKTKPAGISIANFQLALLAAEQWYRAHARICVYSSQVDVKVWFGLTTLIATPGMKFVSTFDSKTGGYRD